MAAPPSGPTISEPPAPGGGGDPFSDWCEALAARHLRELTFPEVRRGLTALSAVYVEERRRLARGAALDGAGKRAAFALFYGPVHYLVTREIAGALGASRPAPARLFDLGCGTGAAGAAWAIAAGRSPEIVGVDVSPWALAEARWTWSHFGLRGRVRTERAEQSVLGGPGAGILAAFTVNELEPPSRERLLANVIAAAERGARVLVIEPIAKRSLPWWGDWERAFAAAGGRADLWRLPAVLPERLRLLDKAAGLHHDLLTARSLYLPGGAAVLATSDGKRDDRA